LAQTAYEPGNSYFGHSKYIEYLAGDMPLDNSSGVRDTASNRTNFSLTLAQALDFFFKNHYRLDLRTGAAP
jgi:hypothetical protein